MSIVTSEYGQDGEVIAKLMNVPIRRDEKTNKDLYDGTLISYAPDDATKNMRDLILRHFTLGVVTMQRPRIEFNDLSVLLRDQTDQLSFNVYQPNNGEASEADVSEAWRSRAIRPVVRNKAMSIAAHATARTIFPKIFAHDEDNDEQEDASEVMMDLMEWAADQSNYEYYALIRVLMSLWSPASIGLTEYAEVYRKIKTEQENGKWKEEYMLDETMSGFRDEAVPVDQLYIENFYEPDVQKQGWLILRRVISYDLAQAKYGGLENFKYVMPGVQILYNDANQAWYQVYDPNMRQYEVEEIIYWNKSLDVRVCLVNGVMLSKPDCPNPRNDKLYPFDKFGYSIINTRCFYYKSLAFYLQGDADIVNTLYPMIIDKTYLDIMKPMVNTGGQVIRSNVFVPGAVTTLDNPNADLKPIDTQRSSALDGMKVLEKVESSLTESAANTENPGQNNPGNMTAYEISKIEQNAQIVLGLFVKMISQHVKDHGRLRLNDILQFLTIPEISAIEENDPLVYKTFIIPDKYGSAQGKTRKISFDTTLPDEKISRKDYLKLSYDLYENEQGRKQTVSRVNPSLFRRWKYRAIVSPDVMNPMSEDLERAFGLEEYDRMVKAPQMFDAEETGKLLLSLYPRTKKDPKKYLAKSIGMPTVPGTDIQLNQNSQGPTPGGQGAKPAIPSPLSTPGAVAPAVPGR